MSIRNLTNLTVRLAGEDDEVYHTIEPDAAVKVSASGREVDLDGVPIELTSIGAIEGLPEPQEGTYYIVPQPVAYVLNRPDLLLPDTGPSALPDENGRVYAVRRLYSVFREEA